MNTDVLRGKWNQMKGQVKSKWGQLTDDELMQINGDKDKLIGKLQQKYGRTKDEISREVESFFKQFDTQSTTQKTGTGQRVGGQDSGDEPSLHQDDRSTERKRKIS